MKQVLLKLFLGGLFLLPLTTTFAVNKCPGEPVKAGWSSAGCSGNPLVGGTLVCAFTPGSPSSGPIVIGSAPTSGSCTGTMSCSGPGGSATPSSDTVSVVNGPSCCGQWSQAGLPTWNGSTCVAAASSCTSQSTSWSVGANVCYSDNVTGGISNGGSAVSTDSSPTNTGSATFVCNGASNTYVQQAGATCSAAAPSTCNLPWGGTIANGASVTAYQSPSVTSPASCVSQTRTCSSGTLSGSYTNQTCTVAPAGTCGGYQTWGSGCSATFPVTAVGDNTPSTNNTGADYAGWAVMKCLSPGAFGYVSGSCAYTPVPTGDPCPQYASVSWNPGCYGRLEPVGGGMFPVADGGSGWAYNTAPGYTTASLGFFSCSNGSWLPAGGTCNAITSCGPGSGATPKNPEPIGASACSSGPLNSSSPADTSLAWNWTCGSSSCSAPKYGCNALHATNYNASGPANTYGCSGSCDSGWVWNAMWARCDGAPPDLTPLAVGTIPAVPAPGVAAQHFFTVKNAGGTAVPTFTNYMKIATGPGGSGTVTYDNSLWAPALSADETRTVNNPYTFPTAGTYSLQICVDLAGPMARFGGTIVESNEGNNCSGWIDVNVGTCANGANNPPTCNQCPVNLYWNTTTSSCSPCGSTGCTGPGGNPSTPIPPTLVCNNGGTPPLCTPLPTASLVVGATNLSYNGQTSLTWSSTGASPSGCVAGGPWLNSPNNAGSGLTDPLTTTSTFTFQCTGPTGTSALVSRTITVCSAATPIWTGAVCRPAPSVVSLIIAGQYTPSGILKFSCSDADHYEVWRGLRNVGTLVQPSTPYPGIGVSVPVSIAGNYNVHCSALDWTGARIWSSPSVIWYSPVYPTPPVMFITASPKTIQKGSESAITWNVKYPNSACKITASPVCSGECTTAKDGVKIENTRLLNSKLTSPSEMTDANDPNGRRKVTESFWKPINPLADDKISAGKKTFLFNSTTDFTLDCNTTVPLTTDPVKKVRVNVTSSNEG